MSKSAERALKILNIDTTGLEPPEEADPIVWDMLDKCAIKFDKETGAITQYPRPFNSRSNLAKVLENDPRFDSLAYNPQSDTIMLNSKPFKPSSIEDIGIMLETAYYMRVADKSIQTAVMRVAQHNEFLPIRNYLDSLPIGPLPEESVIDRLLQDRYHAQYSTDKESKLITEFARCFLISAVARQYDPGCEVHSSLVLISTHKGAGKGMSLKKLVGEQFYSNSPLAVGKKHGYMQIHQSNVWLWELAEMASLQGKSAEVSKAFFTGAWDRYVSSYATMPAHMPRRLIFVLTANTPEFLDDGAERRFHPIKIKHNAKIDVEWIEENRDQIWQEARYLYNAGIPWWFANKETDRHGNTKYRPDYELEKDLADYQDVFKIDDPWASIIKEEVNRIEHGGYGKTSRELMEALQLPVGLQHVGNSKRIAAICKELGFVQRNKNGARNWINPEHKL